VNDELKKMCKEDDVIHFMPLFRFVWLNVKKQGHYAIWISGHQVKKVKEIKINICSNQFSADVM
jgi:competence transcription factor ComK